MALNFDSYRMEHESEIEWGLRKKFLEAHADKYEGNRLLCLASCFINIEMYGCRYPNEVMIEMKGLIEEIFTEIQEFREGVRERNEVKFVKSSDSAEPASKTSGKQPLKYGNFVKPSSNQTNDTPDPSSSVGSSSQQQAGGSGVSNSSKDQPPTSSAGLNPGILKGFHQLATALESVLSTSENSTSALYAACQKVNMSLTTQFDWSEDGNHICHININSVRVANGRPCAQRKESKKDAFENAVMSLSKPHLYIRPEPSLLASDHPIERLESDGQLGSGYRNNLSKQATEHLTPQAPPPRGRKRKYQYEQAAQQGHDIFNNFYLLEQLDSETPVAILNQSSGFSKARMEWEYVNEKGQMRCMLTFCGPGLPVGNAVGETKQVAKRAAAEQALSYLRQHCWTILIKQTADSGEVAVKRDEVLGNEAAVNVELPESNVGSKLMKLMGWSGGGIGKNEQGIKEPISVSTVINRQGLGRAAAQGIQKSFIPQIKSTLQEYARSDSETDLVFNSEFTKEERAAIHNQCKRLNLKSHSHGTGEDRYLIVSRKRSANQLFERLQREGGESDKYRLIPPGQRTEGEEEEDY